MAAFLERGQTKIPGVTQNQRLALARAILALPERQRQALVLRHFEGMSNPGIGERLDCSVEAVESLLARARRRLAMDMSDGHEQGERGVWR